MGDVRRGLMAGGGGVEFGDDTLDAVGPLLGADFAFENGKKYYYHGYAYEGISFYDYKKRFRALESYDWQGNWEDFRED